MKANFTEMQIQRDRVNAEAHPSGGMKILLHYRGLNPRPVWQGLVEAQLKPLGKLAAIASARVSLEWQPDVAPAFRVIVWLEVPGPDFHAEASDHTVEAALLKVVQNLERQIRLRKSRRMDNRKTKVQLGLFPGRSR
jgi:ribosome-associated translation inhibitor RaiA